MTKTKSSKNLTGATLLTSDTLPTMPGPRDFIGHYFSAQEAFGDAEEAVNSRSLSWEELPKSELGFAHYTQRGVSPSRIWTAAFLPVGDRTRYFIVLEF